MIVTAAACSCNQFVEIDTKQQRKSLDSEAPATVFCVYSGKYRSYDTLVTWLT